MSRADPSGTGSGTGSSKSIRSTAPAPVSAPTLPSKTLDTAVLPAPTRFALALAAVSAAARPPAGAVWSAGAEQGASAEAWLRSLLAMLDLRREVLPEDVEPGDVAQAAAARGGWDAAERERIAKCLVQAALAPVPDDAEGEDEEQNHRRHAKGKDKGGAPHVAYSPVARAAAHRTLALLGLDSDLLPRVEAELGASLAAALDGSQVDEARSKQRQGWGGTLGRSLATGAGVVVGGVLIGVTGGLATPALAALLAPLGIGAVLTASAAPVVLGTLFGLTGGGLAGWRVHERWRGVDEFAFVEVGAGTRPTHEEVGDLRVGAEDDTDKKEEGEAADEDPADVEARKEVEKVRAEVLERLANMSLEAGTDRGAVEDEDDDGRKKTMPTLTATIIVPGLLTASRTEALAAWRAVCSPHGALPQYAVRKRRHRASGGDGRDSTSQSLSASDSAVSPSAPSSPSPPPSGYEAAPYSASDVPSGLKDGRDVYVLRYETKTMLATGRDIETWVASKLKTLAATEVIKRTVLGAYYVAIALPLSVYKLSSMTLDNSWIGAQAMAVKAGRLLGEVLAQRVQGERPVILIGTSVGALTVLHALLYLSTLPAPPLVESAFLVSLPSAPTADEWAAARRVVARRLVNAWSESDLVLASVVRLHEVVSRAASGSNGVCVAGLGAVRQPGVEDVDVSDAVGGHFEINMRIPEVLELLEIDD